MASPAYLEGGGGQDRARGRHLTAANTLSAFGRFNQWGGGGGGGGGGLVWCHEKFGPGGKSVRPGPAGPNMTPKFVRLIKNWSGHINTSYTWRLVLVYVKMNYSSGEGDAKMGT